MRLTILGLLAAFLTGVVGGYVGGRRSDTRDVSKPPAYRALGNERELAEAVSRIGHAVSRLEASVLRLETVSKLPPIVNGVDSQVSPLLQAGSEEVTDAPIVDGPSADEIIASRHEEFEQEARDDRWADGLELESLETIRGWDGVVARRVECRSSRCVLDLEFATPQAVDLVDLAKLPATSPGRVSTSEERSPEGHVTRWRIIAHLTR